MCLVPILAYGLIGVSTSGFEAHGAIHNLWRGLISTNMVIRSLFPAGRDPSLGFYVSIVQSGFLVWKALGYQPATSSDDEKVVLRFISLWPRSSASWLDLDQLAALVAAAVALPLGFLMKMERGRKLVYSLQKRIAGLFRQRHELGGQHETVELDHTPEVFEMEALFQTTSI